MHQLPVGVWSWKRHYGFSVLPSSHLLVGEIASDLLTIPTKEKQHTIGQLILRSLYQKLRWKRINLPLGRTNCPVAKRSCQITLVAVFVNRGVALWRHKLCDVEHRIGLVDVMQSEGRLKRFHQRFPSTNVDEHHSLVVAGSPNQ
jgi:hypothetical protein